MAARRGKNQARRTSGNGRSSGRPAWVWMVAGLAIGAVVFLAVPDLLKKDGDGFARFGPRATREPRASRLPIATSECPLTRGASSGNSALRSVDRSTSM